MKNTPDDIIHESNLVFYFSCIPLGKFIASNIAFQSTKQNARERDILRGRLTAEDTVCWLCRGEYSLKDIPFAS
jgi:hypothetical protein